MQRDLVELARRGDHDAFEALASAAFDGLYALALRIVRDADRTDDAVQDCLIRAWKQLPRLRDPDRFDAWLRRLLVSACSDQSRHTRRRSVEIRVLPLERPGGRDATSDLADRDQLERGFRRLSVEQRAVLVMTHYLGMRAGEIAGTLGIPVGTVQSRLLHATRAMRAVLEADARPALVAEGGRRPGTVRRISMPGSPPGSTKERRRARARCCPARSRRRVRLARTGSGSHDSDRPRGSNR
jgi:RNA polymerase sigma-70 factor (ECF subfamily)